MLEEGKCVSDTFLPEGEAPALLVLSLHPLPWMRAPDLGQHLLSDPASAFKQSTFRRRPVYTDSIKFHYFDVAIMHAHVRPW